MPEGIRDILRRLRGLNLNFSLCRVSLRPGSDGRLGPVDDAYLVAECAEDGSLIVVFIHPPGVNDDASAQQVLSQRLSAGLRRQGLAGWALRFSVMHCDAAALDEGEALLAVLFEQAQHPFNCPQNAF